MFKLFKYTTKKERCFAVIALIFVILGVWLDLKLPDYMREITQLVQTQGSQLGDVLNAGGKMIICSLLSAGTTIVVGYTVAHVAAGFAKTLRNKVYSKTIDFGKEEISKFSNASLITRTTNDVMQIQMFIAMGLQAIARAPIMAAWAAFKIAGKSWQWTTATVVAVIILIMVMITISCLVIPRFKIMQKLTDNLNKTSRENIVGIRVVHAYNAEMYQHNKFEQANNELTRTQLFTTRSMSFLFPTVGMIMSGLTLAIYTIGVLIINDASVPARLPLFSDMVVFSSYAMQIIMSFMMITVAFFIGPRAFVAAGRINEVLDTNIAIVSGKKTKVDDAMAGTVEFKNVTFKYPDAEHAVLRNISFIAKKGETVAIIGSTGSGKSSLVQLIPRLFDCTSGEILLDGNNVCELDEHFLRKIVGYIPQKPFLFKGTIKSNIIYGEVGQVDESRIEKALMISQASDFVKSLDLGLNSKVAQSGSNLSGGQRQRISIARAIYKNPEIIIFDDSFSALDYKTDSAVREALTKELGDTTRIIVAQRIGTIIDADQILVIDDGHVVGHGKHSELLKTCKVYREIAESQLSEEELKNAR